MAVAERSGCWFQFLPRPVSVEQEARWRPEGFYEGEVARRDAFFEQALALAEDNGGNPQAVFIDEVPGDQRLE
jgi:hypothetical protein